MQRIFEILGTLNGFFPLCAWLKDLLRDCARFSQPLLGKRSANSGFQPGQFSLVGFLSGRRIDIDHRRPATGHDAVKRVVILLANRIELVIVTTRTRNCETKERLGHNINLILGCSHQLVERIRRSKALQHETIMSRTDRRFVQAKLHVKTRLRQQVAGDVFAQQLVVRHIGIERTDEVVTILVGIRDGRIALAPE